MQHCCVIGCAGFIGIHVVNALAGRHRQVTVIDRNPVPPGVFPGEVKCVTGDYGDDNLLAKTLRGVDEVINLAYSTVPKTSFEDPVQDITGNLPSAVRLFEVASALAVKKVVLVSSGGTVYGRATELPITEDHPTNPISPYGITKLSIEKYGLMYKELKGLPVVCVRPANAYGEGQRPFVGQGFVATAIASVLNRQEISLFGENGTIRDYIHVTDIAAGIAAVLDSGTPGSCYNIGTGVGKSNRDVLDAIYPLAKSAGFDLRPKLLPPREFDVPANILDSKKLTKETGWGPLVPFELGIERTWNWFLRQQKLSG